MKHKAPSIPPLSSGIRYGSGLNGERICLGAQMGRRNTLPEHSQRSLPCKLRLVRMRMVDYGCYDTEGAYWGQGAPLYRAVGDCGDVQAEIFVRGTTRAEAKAHVREFLKGATFYR